VLNVELFSAPALRFENNASREDSKSAMTNAMGNMKK